MHHTLGVVRNVSMQDLTPIPPIPCPEPHQLRVSIIQSTRKSKGLEAGIRVGDDLAELIVVHPLDNGTGGDIDDKPRAAEMVADDPVGHPALDQVVGHVALARIHKAGHYCINAIEFRHRGELILIQEALDQRAVDLLANVKA
jgi:hypothetical protein